MGVSLEEHIHWQVLGAIGLLAVALGATASRTNFCTMGAVSDWVNMEDTGRLRAWLLAIAVATGAVVTMEAAGLVDLSSTFPPYRTALFAWPRYLLGGLMFGVGMTLGSGCGNKTLVRLGGGNMKSLVVAIIVATMAYFMLWTDFYDTAFNSWMGPLAIDLGKSGMAGQGIDHVIGALLGGGLSGLHTGVGLLLAVGLAAWAFSSGEFRAMPGNWAAGLLVGAIVAAGWWVTGGHFGTQWKEWAEMADTPPLRVATQSFTFISALGDGARYALHPTNTALIGFGLVAALGVVIGSFLNALFARELRFEWFVDFADFRNHAIGAVLMGIGGVLSMGCTIGQGITGVSTLALGSVLTLVSIIAGAAATMKLQYRFA